MLKKTLLICFSILVLSGLTWYVSSNIPEFINSVTELIIEKYPKSVVEPAIKTAVFNIADGTGSTHINYAIPQLDTSFISTLLDKMFANSGGHYWLSYINRNSKNNKVLYFTVPSALVPKTKPTRLAGEPYFDYDKRLREFEEKTKNFKDDSLNNYKNYLLKKEEFLISCQLLLISTIYVKGSVENKWTDAIGSLNAAFYTMNNIQDSSVQKYIVAFSDLEQDTPYLKPKPELNTILPDLELLAVNPVPGSSKKVTENVIEFEHPSRVLEYIFHNNW